MIDLTLSSDEDNQHAETPHAYDSEKENVEPTRKRPFEMCSNDIMPYMNRKLLANED